MVLVPSLERLAVGELRPLRVEQLRFLYFCFADTWVRLTCGPRLSATQLEKDSSFVYRFGANFEKC